jgi:hypothetical protein
VILHDDKRGGGWVVHLRLFGDGVELQIPRLPRISCPELGLRSNSCGSLGENHISSGGKSGEVGNPGALGMTKGKDNGSERVVTEPRLLKTPNVQQPLSLLRDDG